MKKLYAFISVLILTMAFCCISCSASDVVYKSSKANPRFFGYGNIDVPSDYKLAYVNYDTNNLDSAPFNPGYVYAIYVPNSAVYLEIPDSVNSDGTFASNLNIYIYAYDSNNVRLPYSCVTSIWRSYDPVTLQPSSLYDNYKLVSEGNTSWTSIQYAVLYMEARRVNGDPFFKPTRMTLNYFLDESDLEFHFNATVESDGAPYKLTYYEVPSSVTFSSYQKQPVQYKRESFLITASGDTPYSWFKQNFTDLLKEVARKVFEVGNNIFSFDPNVESYKSVYYYSADTVTAIGYQSGFDMSDYTNDYQILGSIDVTGPTQQTMRQTFNLDVDRMDYLNHLGGLYNYDEIGVICVLEMNNAVEIARFDFSRSAIKALNHEPNFLISPIQTIQLPADTSIGEINDLNDLAEYLNYVYNTTNTNNYITYNNTIADLQSIPWGDYISTGFTNGFANFMPTLSAEFDSLFGSLFDDFAIDFTTPSDDDMLRMQALIEDAEEIYDSKTYWRVQIKNEVYYIITTVLTAGDDPPVFNADLSEFHDLGWITLFDARQIDQATRDTVKNVITVFCSIGLAFYIFKTLPSTIGGTPSD